MRITLVLGLMLVSGCIAYVHSPPGRSFPLETSKALYKRETGIQLEAGGGVGADVGLPGFNLRVRHGIVDKLDGSFELGYLRIKTDGPNLANSDRNLVTGRLGVKYEIIKHIAVTAGVAGGAWAGGTFVSPDVSLILAWENPYVVPFVDGGGYTSHPLGEKPVRIVEDFFRGNSEVFRVAPVFTYGWTAGFGLRIPLVRNTENATAPAIVLGTRFRGAIYEIQEEFGRLLRLDRQLYWYGSFGFEYVFAPRRSR
ncbi:MAG: hypothetical protein OEM16_03980 [Myxococcales bacterium]|nr:hypothetical protein [Myxococcales bacterium]